MMKRISFSGIALLLLCFFVCVVSCAEPLPEEGFPMGEWSLADKPEEPVLRVSADGTALYNGTEYTWEDDGQFLLLADAEGESLRLRYLVTGKTVYLYLGSGYTRKEGTAGEGIVGVWNRDGSQRSFFEFTANQRFLEDGVFDGRYEVDYENGSFTLIYPMYFDDTVCYFLQEGDSMTIEYPWTLTETVREP